MDSQRWEITCVKRQNISICVKDELPVSETQNFYFIIHINNLFFADMCHINSVHTCQLYLLGCNVLQSCRWLPIYQRNVVNLTYKTTLHHNSEGHNKPFHYCENIKSQSVICWFLDYITIWIIQVIQHQVTGWLWMVTEEKSSCGLSKYTVPALS